MAELPPPMKRGISLAELDPHEIDWNDLAPSTKGGRGQKMEFLRRYPGCWFHAGTKAYKGGFSDYTRRGFRHAVRKSEDGWDHYLSWPDEAEAAA